jgi:hypothetical protein
MNIEALVNVKLEIPTENVPGWNDEAEQWLALNNEIGGNPKFYPLTIKAGYVLGVIHCLCDSVTILLNSPNTKRVSYIPAYGVFASGIELLGRCLRGNSKTRGSGKDLSAGFKWLASCFFVDYEDVYERVPTNIVLIQTGKYKYSINNLIALRHFAAHGQATSKEVAPGTFEFGFIDFEILEHMPHLIASGLEKFWKELMDSEDLCNKLAFAKVIVLRGWPVLQSWRLFEVNERGKYHSVEDIFNRFNWHIS